PDKQLCAAIEYQRKDLLEKVMESSQVDLTKPNDHCAFLLADAATRGYVDIAAYLLQKRSPLVMRVPHSHHLVSALDAAAASKHGRTDILELLKQNGSTINDSREAPVAGSVVETSDHANLTPGSSTLIQALA